jgi:cobalamin biosynthesis Mg chelatase CobN
MSRIQSSEPVTATMFGDGTQFIAPVTNATQTATATTSGGRVPSSDTVTAQTWTGGGGGGLGSYVQSAIDEQKAAEQKMLETKSENGKLSNKTKILIGIAIIVIIVAAFYFLRKKKK